METSVEDKLDATMGRPNALGVVAADRQGLCLGHRGEGKPSYAGQVAALCQEANKLIKKPEDIPVIVLETSEGKGRSMVIKQCGDTCTGVIMDSLHP